MVIITGGFAMDCNFGFFEEMDRYEAWRELNEYHDTVDSIPTRPSFEEVNTILSRYAQEEIMA